ncbi:MAG TPA: 4-alpha-glucanotransferase [Thermomicrobiales bacterium]|nr:4-alpha-glucanotransferase [Thermomicrobiales bacterium]
MEPELLSRGSGILLHPTSLPGPDGIGDLGDGAYRFVDWLALAKQRYWQVMPLVPTGFGDSPYAAPSAFAGNPLLISLDILIGDGLLDPHAFRNTPFTEGVVNFSGARTQKERALRAAFGRFTERDGNGLTQEFKAFRKAEASWLDDFCLFTALKAEQGGAAWSSWPDDVRRRTPEAMKAAKDRLASEIRYHAFCQWLFRRQWVALRIYANERGIRIIGDIPIFVAFDSADVWANPSQFRLNEDLNPVVVAGVPPDYFSRDGQRWGNPIYDWSAMAADGYAWWVKRFRALLALVDVVRIDHFRGFAANWSVPADAPTAAEGRWERGPGRALFDAVFAQLGEVPIIVEDLGLITPDVVELRKEIGLPGMAVLQFAFDGNPHNAYLPHEGERNSVLYTGTHDNQTTIGWFASVPENVRTEVLAYLGRDGSDIAWDFIRTALNSQSMLAVIPLQDVLRRGDEARMNTPGRPEGNWTWRMRWTDLDSGLAEGLGLLTYLSGRATPDTPPAGFDPYDYTHPGTAHPLHDSGVI